MKKLLLSLMLIPAASGHSWPVASTVLVEARSGEWPITLEKSTERTDPPFFLEFRDQQHMSSVVLDTLPFSDLGQLKYFEKALVALKNGHNGDIAQFKDYSVKKVDTRTQGRWYILRYQWGLTNFQQPEADTLMSTIRKL